MTNPLQQALAPLAETAGYEVRAKRFGLRPAYWYTRLPIVKSKYENRHYQELPGANGSLEGEVEVVLGWLAKAGYKWAGQAEALGPNFYLTLFKGIDRITGRELVIGKPGYAGTLHEALAEAVKALPRDDV